MNQDDTLPPITALICTADRPEMVCQAVESILKSGYPRFELLVVDQSRNDETGAALRRFQVDDRFRTFRSTTRGKGAALNEGLSRARTDLIACTDDDCVVSPDWLERITTVFAGRPAVAVAFGNVQPAPHDQAAGFVPDYRIAKERLIASVAEMSRSRGLGACMGIRRSSIEALGGFDPSFGPGAMFPSCDDWDIAFRALLGGYLVYETPDATVVHHGFRTFREGKIHARRDWYAVGAVCAKPLKAGYWSIAPVALDLLVVRAVCPPFLDVLHGRRPAGLARVAAFAQGFVRGMRTPVRRDALVFDVSR